MSLPWKYAIVVGATSGIGEAIARELLAKGVSVAALGRRSELLNALQTSNPKALLKMYSHDVRNYAEIPGLLQTIAHDLGGLDLIVYSSGVMPDVSEHEYSFEKDREMIEVNLLGGMAWLDEAAKRFEQTKQGTIVGISSIAGERGRRGNPAYCTSKAAFTTFLESLRNRLSRYGIKVITVKPGFIDTPMVRGKKGLFWLISAEQAAKEIIFAAQHGSGTSYVPARWRYVSVILKLIPSAIFRFLPI